jgi:hypothetical protein
LSSNRSRKATAARRSRPPRPLPKGSTLFTPAASPGRQVLEQRSATSLLWLHQLPAWVPPILAVILLIGGLALKGWAGGAALIGLALVLGWLAVISWPRLSAPGRLLRVVVIGGVLVLAVIRGLH